MEWGDIIPFIFEKEMYQAFGVGIIPLMEQPI